MPTASWDQLERSIESLHATARTPVGAREFYRQLIGEAKAAIEALGGAAWRRGAGGRPEMIFQSLPDDAVEPNWSARLAAVDRVLAGGVATLASLDAAHDVLCCAVASPAADADAAATSATAVIELWLPAGAAAPVQQAWLDFAAALADVASDFHARDDLRRQRAASDVQGRAVELVRRAALPRTLAGVAFEIVNEARRVLECDRVSLLMRRGKGWRLLAASGADETSRSTEFARRSESLAAHAANWGEPVESPGGHSLPAAVDLPPELASAIEAHLDHSQARSLAAVPLRLSDLASDSDRDSPATFDAVLLAERFHGGSALREPLADVGELCAPLLGRARALDRFPVGIALRWSERVARLREPWRLSRAMAWWALAASIVASLVFIKIDFHVEAPARLAAALERDVFATATGAVAAVHVQHGALVEEGTALIELSDPELALMIQENRGEIDATRKRLSALAVSRTDRTLREGGEEGRLPLAAEQRELEERLASLERQRTLLDAQREALTLRSPCAGQVITRDVENLLASRPVERGQALLTIANTESGWELRADVPQRKIGHVLAARKPSDDPLQASYRLAGDVEATYAARVVAISAAAPLDAEGLRDEAAPVEVRLAVEGAPPAAARSGMAATVRIHCGRRSLGYVWLHDVAATLYRWATF